MYTIQAQSYNLSKLSETKRSSETSSEPTSPTEPVPIQQQPISRIIDISSSSESFSSDFSSCEGSIEKVQQIRSQIVEMDDFVIIDSKAPFILFNTHISEMPPVYNSKGTLESSMERTLSFWVWFFE
jgi:hypothetical protein